MEIEKIYFKLGNIKISRGTNANKYKFFKIRIGHAWLTFFRAGLMGGGHITKNIHWEIDISRAYDSVYFNSSIGRYRDHLLYILNFNIFKILYFMFEIYDNREWDYYKIQL